MTKPHSLQDQGASSGPGARASHQAAPRLDHSASPPRAFTPGPWLRENAFVYALDETKSVNRFSANVYGGYTYAPSRTVTPEAEREANARLIAAAPELYEALSDIMENPLFQTAIGGNPNMVERLMDRANAALRKARGQQ